MNSLKPYMTAGLVEAGCDEAGRGCIAGPVSCAAVILPHGFSHELLNDSKQLTARQRSLLRPIIEREAVAWAVVMVSPEEIDRINILNASITGMQRALDALGVVPEHVIVDGNRFRRMARCAMRHRSEGRRHLHEHSSRLHPRQDPPRRTDDAARRRTSRLRLGAQHGLSDEGARSRPRSPRPHSPPPPQLRPLPASPLLTLYVVRLALYVES